MDEKSLKTSVGQRIVILIIAVLLLAGTMLTYLFAVMGSSKTDTSEAEINEIIARYDAKNEELNAAAKPLSDKYYPEFNKFRDRIKSYNEQTAENAVLATDDLKVGGGRELGDNDKNYAAYYVGWCADGSIFDSSYDNKGKEDEQPDPTGFNAPLDVSTMSSGMIKGWEQGVVGMKLGGIRQLTISSSLAYGETREICGGYNKPLKFLVMAVEPDESLQKLNEELSAIYRELYLAYSSVSGE